ncbi:ribonuclease H [Senna tora]|uniref:Ribonuclease H n=1 Tax=Senna tora TaxID=362788 RepID=A0A834WT96_9FABA|nr:ribonuclease H [Senna tora]
MESKQKKHFFMSHYEHGNIYATTWNLNKVEIPNTQSDMDSTWIKPVSGWVKINCDGAVCISSQLVGCGELIRDASGTWIFGFMEKLGRSIPFGS